jgi:hypothetical protein
MNNNNIIIITIMEKFIRNYEYLITIINITI